MRKAVIIGGSFGLTSGIITTLGLLVGLNSGTHSRPVVIGGIITIAIADAFSDAFGMHISQEAGTAATSHVWLATLSTFVSKLVLAMSFLVPVLLLELTAAVLASIVWGFGLLGLVSYWIAARNGASPWRAVGEHFLIGGIVVVTNHFVGTLISGMQ